MAEEHRFEATGRRKTSVARVRLRPGAGQIFINGRRVEDYLRRAALEMIMVQPLQVTESRDKFVEEHGMLGFSPTQGHVASAMPFMAHAVDDLRAGDYQYSMFLAKGSLFLGRMTHMSDGMSFILERNPSA